NEQSSEFNTGQVQLDDSKSTSNHIKNDKTPKPQKEICIDFLDDLFSDCCCWCCMVGVLHNLSI
ncbi:MAG: hypothetical protein ACKO96_26860, partial [Flammeovirgaceae bacterium]